MTAATIVTKTRTGYTVTTVRQFSDAYDTSMWLSAMRNYGAPADAAAEDTVTKDAISQAARPMAHSYFEAP